MILALSTSQSFGSVAFSASSEESATDEPVKVSLKGDEVKADAAEEIQQLTWDRSSSHSETITEKIRSLVPEKSLADLKGIIVDHGPGSFTGVRVGVNVARSLAYAYDVPVVGVNSLELLFRQSQLEGKVGSVLYGFRDIVYCAIWERKKNRIKALKAPLAAPFTEVERELEGCDFIVGNAHHALEFSNVLIEKIKDGDGYLFPVAGPLIENFAQDLCPRSSWRNLVPCYLRKSEPEEKKKTLPS